MDKNRHSLENLLRRVHATKNGGRRKKMKRRQNKESKGDEDEVGDGIKWRKEGRKTKKETQNVRGLHWNHRQSSH